HFHGSFHSYMGALLLRSQNCLGRFKQIFSKLAMGYHDHSNHYSSRLSKTEMPMFDRYIEALTAQMRQNGLGHGHGTMSATRTAEGHGQTVAPFRRIERQGKIQKFKKS